jgi:lipopolysaccharide transport system ATP-binding protein
MGEEIVISLKNISKCFKCYIHPVDRLKEIFLPNRSRANEFWALRDINLEIPKGETVGIVGKNGSGKSTLLQIIAGTLTPTTGEVIVNGRVSALLELGSGFNPEFTGRQNVFFNGRLLGLSQKEIEDRFEEIASFADIGDFIDQPVKTYSSGMFVRLAFAVAVNVDPEILIIDEALAVGDIVFQHRCMRRMRSLMDSGVTTLFVSHDSGTVKTLCNSAVMIHEGKIYFSGIPNAVIIKYMKLVTETELGIVSKEEKISIKQQINQQVLVKSQSIRRGNRKALIKNIRLLNQL